MITDRLRLREDAIVAGLAAAELVAEQSNRSSNPPFGCVIARNQVGRLAIVMAAQNEVNATGLTTAHAEIRAIDKLERRDGRGTLENYVLFSAMESCPGCFTFAIKAGLRHFVYGARAEQTARPYVPLELLAQSVDPLPTLFFAEDPDDILFRVSQVRAGRGGGMSSVTERRVLPAASLMIEGEAVQFGLAF